ncbi:MAG: tRNA 2-thiocytidine biosynthesis protein TtcA [Oscillospiraceae bacterium]|nr:tRNA 2-thiocytidine biosynthesis protein TtcA [Oscillospiraceae bacterium]
MYMKRIISLVRRAIDEYDMIKENDRVAVGVSGGKDSLVLLAALAQLSRYHPKNFTVVGLSIDPGFGGDFTPIYEYAKDLGVEYYVKEVPLKEIIFDIRKESNPCSLCSKMRSGALNDFALSKECKTLALGHHKDDVLETFFLSLLYEGRVNCFSPVTYLDRTDITKIRPLIYVRECDVKAAVRKYDIPVMPKVCPADGSTKRADMHEIIKYLEQNTTPGLKKRLFHAVQQSGISGWKTD